MYGIDSRYTTGSLNFPVFGILCYTVNFLCLVLTFIILSCKNIIVISAFIECSKQRKSQRNCDGTLNVIGIIIVLYQNFIINCTCLNTHQSTVRAGSEIRTYTMTIISIVLCFYIISIVHFTGGLYIRVCLYICFHCRVFHSGFQSSIHRTCHYFLFYFWNFLFCVKFLYFIFIRIRKRFFSGAKCFFAFFCAVLICKSF